MHALLAGFSQSKHIKLFDRLLVGLEKELASLGCAPLSVNLLEQERQGSALRRFLTLESPSEPDQCLVVETTVDGRSVGVMLPARRGVTLPYAVSIAMAAPLRGTAVFRKGLLGRKWELSPPDEERVAGLRALRFPAVNWKHVAGGYTSELRLAHELRGDEEDPARTHWVVHSGYQGFVIGVRPRVARYVEFAPRLESLLQSWQG